jgi:hypothetical protein
VAEQAEHAAEQGKRCAATDNDCDDASELLCPLTLTLAYGVVVSSEQPFRFVGF